MTKYYDDPNSSSTWMVGIISALVLLVSILLLQILYYGVLQDEMASKQNNFTETRALRDSQVQQIEGSVRWIDEESGVVGMPIEMAMERVVASQHEDESER